MSCCAGDVLGERRHWAQCLVWSMCAFHATYTYHKHLKVRIGWARKSMDGQGRKWNTEEQAT
eukprot:5800600-Alexandrium_andersonii.AAC.1